MLKCQEGVRQGYNLSPLLFNLFISGLEVELANDAGVPQGETTLDTVMFADDIILLSTSAGGLNKQIDTLEEFCSQWNHRINSKICALGARKHYTSRM